MKRPSGTFLPTPVVSAPKQLAELWFVPSDGRAPQRWLGPSPVEERYPGYGAWTVRNRWEQQMAFGAGRIEMRPVAR